MTSFSLYLRPSLFKSFRGILVTRRIFGQPLAKMEQTQNTMSTIAVCQFTARNNKEENFQICKKMVKSASDQGAKMIFLPEGFDFIGENKKETITLAETIDGPLIRNYTELAKTNNVWLSLGGFHDKGADNSIRNTHLVINNQGSISAAYSKIHMFDVDIPNRIYLKESATIKPGAEIVPPVSTPVGNVGLAICYDIRFPELSTILTKMGAHILTYPSAFTYSTGSMHWETLLRCRAIENQSYVVAAAQHGKHNEKRSSWGHAMIVDPQGNIVAQCSEGTGFAMATIDLQKVEYARTTMPVLNHRRNDLYPELVPLNHLSGTPKDRVERNFEYPDYFSFGQVKILQKTIFHMTSRTMAFTNKRCIVPGHVLVAPLRVVQRVSDMSDAEISDLFIVVKHVQRIVEAVYKATSSTITVQDGPDAGQTIKHVHVHILPRKPNDFLQNDQVYYELQTHDKEGQDSKYWRSEEEMVKEAETLKNHAINLPFLKE